MMLCAPAIFLHREHVIDYKGEQLSSCQFDEEFNSALYHLCFFMFSFVIPLTLIFILYVLMLQRLWFGNVPGGQMSNESVRSKVRSVLSTYILPSFLRCLLVLNVKKQKVHSFTGNVLCTCIPLCTLSCIVIISFVLCPHLYQPYRNE